MNLICLVDSKSEIIYHYLLPEGVRLHHLKSAFEQQYMTAFARTKPNGWSGFCSKFRQYIEAQGAVLIGVPEWHC